MAVLFNAINGFIFFRQQPPARFWLAAALGLVGIITLFWDDLLSNGLNASLLWGIGLSALGTYGFLSAICSVCATSAVVWKP